MAPIPPPGGGDGQQQQPETDWKAAFQQMVRTFMIIYFVQNLSKTLFAPQPAPGTMMRNDVSPTGDGGLMG